jgi:predicted small lipoprotein YifL
MTTFSTVSRVSIVALVGCGAAACGLKGPLELPERSTNIVIRGPGQAPAAETESATGAPSGTAPPTPTSPTPATKPAPPTDERLPPPQLPDGNSGSSRGG